MFAKGKLDKLKTITNQRIQNNYILVVVMTRKIPKENRKIGYSS